MKVLLCSLLLVPSIGLTQVQLQDPGVDVNWGKPKTSFGQRGLINCGTDTVYYVQSMASNLETKILYSDNSYSSAAGQYFRASSSVPVTVHGFRWYGYTFDPVGGGSPVFDVTCAIYAAGSDSLPTGSALAIDTLTIDANPSNATREAIFPVPVVMTSAYVLVVESLNTDYLFVMSSDEDNNDALGRGYSSSYYEPAGEWRKNLNLWALGDFDFVFEPFVNYTIDAKFSHPGQGCVGTPVTFTNTSKGPFPWHHYNQEAFNGSPVRYHWKYGDGNTDAFQQHGSNTYAGAGTYTVTLYDTLTQWTGTCADSGTLTIDIFALPPAPTSTPPPPVCEYTPIDSLTASGIGTDFAWYDDVSLDTLLGNGSPFGSGIILPDTVYVTETVNGCEGPSTQVILDFISNPLPVFTANPLGGTQVQFTGAPVADTYSWISVMVRAPLLLRCLPTTLEAEDLSMSASMFSIATGVATSTVKL